MPEHLTLIAALENLEQRSSLAREALKRGFNLAAEEHLAGVNRLALHVAHLSAADDSASRKRLREAFSHAANRDFAMFFGEIADKEVQIKGEFDLTRLSRHLMW